MERNREEPKGFQHRGRKIKGLWCSLLPLFLPFLQLLHAHVSTLLRKGTIPLHFIKELHFTLLWFLRSREPWEKRGRKGREVENPLDAAGASRGKLTRRWASSGKCPSPQTQGEKSHRPYALSYTCLIKWPPSIPGQSLLEKVGKSFP